MPTIMVMQAHCEFVCCQSSHFLQDRYWAPVYHTVISELLLALFTYCQPRACFSFFLFFFASQLPLSKLDFSHRPSHAALVCIPLPVQLTVPEVDGFQVGANLHPHLGYSDECSRPVMTPPTPAGIEINCDAQFITEPRERMFEHVKVSCHHLCILQLRLA